MTFDDQSWLAELHADDPQRRVRALHAACPCTGSSLRFERYMPLLHQMTRDPNAEVRRVALHLEKDALELLAVEDERANGFRRNRPGGWGKRREPRRASSRQG